MDGSAGTARERPRASSEDGWAGEWAGPAQRGSSGGESGALPSAPSCRHARPVSGFAARRAAAAGLAAAPAAAALAGAAAALFAARAQALARQLRVDAEIRVARVAGIWAEVWRGLHGRARARRWRRHRRVLLLRGVRRVPIGSVPIRTAGPAGRALPGGPAALSGQQVLLRYGANCRCRSGQ